MKSEEKQPAAPVEDEATKPNDSAASTPPEEKPIDPREQARRRSKEDLDRKRRNLRGRGGRF
jgi:hypothetical protein